MVFRWCSETDGVGCQQGMWTSTSGVAQSKRALSHKQEGERERERDMSNACYFPCTYMYCTTIYLWPHSPKPMQALSLVWTTGKRVCSLHQSTFFSQQSAVKVRIYTGKAACILMRERECVWTWDIERDRTQQDATQHAAHRRTNSNPTQMWRILLKRF